VYGIACTRAGSINAQSANARRGGSPAATDFVVFEGGIINATSGTGGLNVTKNTLTASGIIYQP